MKSNYCIVISYDAFSKDNWENARHKPNLAKLIANGASTDKVKSVYPTLTYVIHSSYVTGAYPNKHGVYHNNLFQPFVPESDQNWHWFRNDIKLPTVYDAARKKGLKTAGLLWPVSGKANIDFNIPEIRAVKNENQALKILKNGSKLFTLSMEIKHGKVRNGIEQPELDDFTTLCAIDTIKKKKPNLLLMHLIDLDDTKHMFGTKGPHIEEVLNRMDKRLGDILQAVQDAGIYDDTTFIVVGDHGQLDVQYKVYLNRLFFDNGLIYEENGEMKWRAYVQGAGGAAYLYVQPHDEEALKLALQLLEGAAQNEAYGIEAIYDRQILDSMHIDENFSYMLEAKEGYCFEDAYNKEVIVDLHAAGKVYATHGYSPDIPDYTSNLVISGASVKAGYDIGNVGVIDIGPTIAHILGLDFEAIDGRALVEAFK
ncbi:alkaline phosphatase family protein [Lysinibacillus sp. 2017]|uniref:alkaline phosphatase family protein n=1 Tax=unclassified Lysinibacillus TaxID=2636778 RepID=UPI000D527002|nr:MULTISPECIES: ectonucleotide pyrophosphatase/phosphodiesterase [unclassified Lysinibacillus]AWE07117.1 alkaline phosphatase family protein [Lysinibacillus sp. 2017]TGN36964.1 alkaline phosphatase family protein [Lysinibacillus sp. S2017]